MRASIVLLGSTRMPGRLHWPVGGHGMPQLQIVPINFDEATAFVGQFHRHHKPPLSHKFSIAVSDGTFSGSWINGVAIVGRPVARGLDDGWTLEVLRCCTDGTANACSKLYSRCWRVAQLLGFRRLVTYILDTEHGTSLNAAGWRCIGKAGGGSWTRPSRPRIDKHPTQGKLRWEVECAKT